MALSSSLNASASALRGYSTKLDADSQNLAAAGVIAGKKRFSYLSSSNTDDSLYTFTPAGIQSAPLINIAQTGTAISAENPLHMAIAGEGFFVVNTASDASVGQTKFTRTGSFTLDKNQNVVNHLGQYLQYFPYSLATGTFANPNTSTTDAAETLNLSGFSGIPQATTSIGLSLSLPGGAAINTTKEQTITIHDALGTAHQLKLSWEKTAVTPATPSQTWSLTVTSAEAGVTINAPYNAAIDIVFDGNGGLPLTFNGAAVMPNLPITWPDGSNDSDIALNFGTVGKSDGVMAGGGNDFMLRTEDVNGYVAGELQNISIADNGEISISFDNGGPSQTIGRIPLATFAAINKLLVQDGDTYIQSSESGGYLLSFSGDGSRVGSIKSSALEESTVDTADVFGDMIVSSKQYTANLKTITTIEKMLDALERAVS